MIALPVGTRITAEQCETKVQEICDVLNGSSRAEPSEEAAAGPSLQAFPPEIAERSGRKSSANARDERRSLRPRFLGKIRHRHVALAIAFSATAIIIAVLALVINLSVRSIPQPAPAPVVINVLPAAAPPAVPAGKPSR